MPVRLAKGLRIVALLACAAAVGSGCGDDEESPAQRSFKDADKQDLEKLDGVSTAMDDFTASWTDFVVASQKEDVDAARKEVDDMQAAVEEAGQAAEGIESGDMRATIDDYLGEMEDVSDVSDEVVEYFADPGGGSAAQEEELLTEFETAVKEAKEADEQLIEKLSANATPEQRKALREQYEDAQRAFEEETGQPGG